MINCDYCSKIDKHINECSFSHDVYLILTFKVHFFLVCHDDVHLFASEKVVIQGDHTGIAFLDYFRQGAHAHHRIQEYDTFALDLASIEHTIYLELP